MNFSLRVLFTVLFLLSGLASVSAHALHAIPDRLHDLSKESICKNLRGSTEILEGFEEWAEAQGTSGIYRWLGRDVYLNGSPRRPLELVQGNAYAVRWFLERAFDERELNSENTRLMELLDNTLQAIPSVRRNDIANRLLETSFGMHGSTWLAEVLFNRLTSKPYLEGVLIDYLPLFERALKSRNYPLITGLLLSSRYVTAPVAPNHQNDSYRRAMLEELASSTFYWGREFDVGEGSEFQWNHPYAAGDSSPTVSDEGANAATQGNEGSQAFSTLLTWLASSGDQSMLAEAMNRAVLCNNEPAIGWLESLGVPRPNIVENYEYQNQRRAENGRLVLIIDDAPENAPSRIWSCFGCFSR